MIKPYVYNDRMNRAYATANTYYRLYHSTKTRHSDECEEAAVSYKRAMSRITSEEQMEILTKIIR